MSLDDPGEDEIRSDLPAYLTGELDALGEARVRAALDGDASLRQELREISEAMTFLEEAGTPPVDESTGIGRRWASRAGLLTGLGVAAAIVVIALVLAVPQMGPAGREQTDQILALDPVGNTNASGTAQMRTSDGNVFVDFEFDSLPDRGESAYYEAWLLSPSDAPPISLGIVPHTGGTLTIPPGVPAEYTIIDLSVEHLDGDPGHSGISVLRSNPA